MSTDPARVSAKPAAPQTWNRYGYALANPLRFVDPDGRESAQYRIDAEIDAYVNHGASPSWHDPTLQKASMVAVALLSPVDEFAVVGALASKIGGVVARLGGRTVRVDAGTDAARASKYEDITRGKSVRNIKTDVTPSDFGKNLEAQGFTRSLSRDGTAQVYRKGDRTYVIRSDKPTAELLVDGKRKLKIRFERE